MAQVTMEQAERLIKANVTEQHLFTHARAVSAVRRRAIEAEADFHPRARGKRGNGRNGGAFRRG